jgi:hypothetical protein
MSEMSISVTQEELVLSVVGSRFSIAPDGGFGARLGYCS